jgi:hypothetical protein
LRELEIGEIISQSPNLLMRRFLHTVDYNLTTVNFKINSIFVKTNLEHEVGLRRDGRRYCELISV